MGETCVWGAMATESTWEAERRGDPAADAEAEVLRRAKLGEDEAWTTILRLYYPPIFRYTMARTGRRETAEDLASAVFVEAVRSIASYLPRGKPLLAWLYAIARNLTNYHHRREFRRGETDAFDSAGKLESAAAPAGDPALLFDAWDLREAVRGLSDDQREVIVLRFFVGLTTPEIARVVGKKERAVYSLYTRAMHALRNRLTGSGGGE